MATFRKMHKKIKDNINVQDEKYEYVERERERERENRGDWYCQIFNQDERVISGCKKGI